MDVQDLEQQVRTLSVLVATPQLSGSLFEKSVLLMLEDGGGAIGLIINQPLGVRLGQLLPNVGQRSLNAYHGGPVERSAGWCLYAQSLNHQALCDGLQKQPAEFEVAPQLWLSRDQGVLEELLAGTQPFYLLLGYSGWAAGQLEQEVRQGSWLWGNISTGDLAELLWHTPDQHKWRAALALLGTPPENVVRSARA